MTPLPVTVSALVCALAVSAAHAAVKDVSHPYILWSKAEAAAIKKRIETDPAAKEQLARMEARDTKGASPRGGGHPAVYNLFKFSVLGDTAAGEKEKAELLKFIGKLPEPLTEQFKADIQKRLDAVGGDWDKIWTRGGASFADRHMRDEQTVQALRYDVLYDILSPEERAGVEKAMRTYIQFHLDGHKPWHADFKYSKAGWLPNMSWPRAIGTHVMAVALKDEKLIEQMFSSTGGFKWYLDEYISDGRFYNEEFGKYYSNNYTMLLYCEGLERLGLPQYGYGYTGKDHGSGGATMKRYMQMFFDITYPRIDIPGGMPSYNQVQMGDAKGSTLGIHGFGNRFTVQGYLPSGEGGDQLWGAWNMNGPFIKGLGPIWYEMMHRRFPNDHFDYFLAQMRKPGDEVHYPTLYSGLGPIDPAKVKPPAAPSYLANQRQFAFLRAEESPAYWEGPWPAVAVQFGGYYPHYAHDSFSLLGFYAFNRPIYVCSWGGKVDHYVHPQIRNGPPTGYLARHPWQDTNRGHAGVTVDNLGPRPVNDGEKGLEKHVMRFESTPVMKFVAGKAKGVFPGVEQERAIVLTREYMFDLFWLADAGGKKRRYEWNVSGQGEAQKGPGFEPTSELNGSMLYRPLPWQGEESQVREEADKQAVAQPAGYENKLDANDLSNVHKLAANSKPWSVSILQTCALPDVSKSKLGNAFYDRNVGVRVSMLPAEVATTVYTGRPPAATSEVGGATILVRREAPSTVFTALHEPFENNAPRPLTLDRVVESGDALVASVTGKGVNDRVLVTFGPHDAKQPVTLAKDQESFTFTSHAHVRIAADTVTVTGNVAELKLKVEGSPRLVVNGEAKSATVAGGLLTFSAK